MDDYTLPENYDTLSEGVERLLPLIMEMVENSIYSQNVHTVDSWQPANTKNLKNVLSIMSQLIYKNSKIINSHYLNKLQELVDQKKSCIIMPEHYSNFDLPGLYYIINTSYPELLPMVENIISLSASKLNAESKIVLAFSEAFHRIMIYPARSKVSNTDMTSQELKEYKQLETINQRAIKQLFNVRDQGKIILMFPSGTRYRPENPESRNALEQSASFLKRFDYVCFIGIAGNTLIVNPNNNMAEDIIRQDSLVYYIDEPKESKVFMSEVEGGNSNRKGIAQHITQHLLTLHDKAEVVRSTLVKETPPRFLGSITSKEGIRKFIEKYKISPEIVAKFF